MRKFVAGFSIAVIAVTIGVFAIPEPDPFPAVPLPKLGDGPIPLRVVRALNPRFNALTEAEFSDVLDQTTILVRDHFGLEVRFERGNDYSMDELFRLIPKRAKEEAFSQIYRLRPPDVAPLELVESVSSQIRGVEISADNVARFVEPFIPGATEMNVDHLAEAITDVWLQRLRRWQGLYLEDGQRTITTAPYHEIMFWYFLGYGKLPFDIVITNQLVASAEHKGFAPHAAMRVGLSNGIAGTSRSGRFGTYAMVSTFALINDLGDLNELGPDPVFEAAKATRYSAMILTHELGHMLLHFGHPWFNPACVMFPVPPGGMGIHMRTIDAAECPIGSEPAMTPSAHQFRYSGELLSQSGPWGRFKSAVQNVLAN